MCLCLLRMYDIIYKRFLIRARDQIPLLSVSTCTRPLCYRTASPWMCLWCSCNADTGAARSSYCPYRMGRRSKECSRLNKARRRSTRSCIRCNAPRWFESGRCGVHGEYMGVTGEGGAERVEGFRVGERGNRRRGEMGEEERGGRRLHIHTTTAAEEGVVGKHG